MSFKSFFPLRVISENIPYSQYGENVVHDSIFATWIIKQTTYKHGNDLAKCRTATFYLLTISIEPLFPCRKPRAEMLFPMLTTILGCLLSVQCRDSVKPFKSIPTITGSLVNLGKMDISFHFNSKESPLKMDHSAPQHSFLFSNQIKSDPMIEEPCLCSGSRGHDNFIKHPSDIMNKILTSSDLFTFNKEVTSTLCCGSHEHAQEDIITFEFGPKDGMSVNPHPHLPRLPFILENILAKKPSVQPMSLIPGKPKAVEVFLFPKKKGSPMFMPIKKDFIKNDIQIVGDKELRNDFKTLKFRPSIPINFQSSVKKDLTAQQKNETNKEVEKEEIEVTTASSPNSLK